MVPPTDLETDTPRLLIVNGLPASGKSTLSRALAPLLGLPLFSKDDLKNLLFDQLGWSDREWSKQIGSASWELLWLIADRTMAGGNSLIIESAFVAERAAERIAQWRSSGAVHIIELHCTAEREILVKRFRSRAHGTDRHPGHDESNPLILETEFIPKLLYGDDALIPGTDGAFTVDTTLPEEVDLDAIASNLRRLLWPPRALRDHRISR